MEVIIIWVCPRIGFPLSYRRKVIEWLLRIFLKKFFVCCAYLRLIRKDMVDESRCNIGFCFLPVVIREKTSSSYC